MSEEAPAPPAWPAWVEEWVLPYLHNRALWPVWFAILGHVVVVLAGLMLLGWRGTTDGWVLTAVLLAASAALTVQEVRVSGRLGGVALSLGLLWLTSVGLAVLAEQTGIL
ncbi:MAG: hypothetical protein KTR31_11485 [Myxococcales bacterium]|nr:hypothetical protein [Myxococcales bacterium]